MRPDWISVVETAIGPLLGTVIGGLIAVLAIYIKEALDQKRSAQTWYEDEYIAKGIDPLLSYVMLIKYQLLAQTKRQKILTNAEPMVLPIMALNKLVVILPIGELVGLIVTLNMALDPKQSPIAKEACLELTTVAETGLFLLHKAMIGIKIESKSQIHAIASKKELQGPLDLTRQSARKAMEAFTNLGNQAARLADEHSKGSVLKSKRVE